jgi:hypothetical protein
MCGPAIRREAIGEVWRYFTPEFGLCQYKLQNLKRLGRTGGPLDLFLDQAGQAKKSRVG